MDCGVVVFPSTKHLAYLLILIGLAYSFDYKDGCSNPYSRDAEPLVSTSSGQLRGKYVKVSDNGVAAAFLSIPYAHPPVNQHRFKRPRRLDHWDNVLDATVKPPPCMQYSSRNYSWIPTSTPSEDCLYLNVWTPAKCCCGNPEKGLPVLVWIYGGGFYAGSTDMPVYDASILVAQNNAIVASINYRVGIFGFLNSGTDEYPGNVGLLDQNMALQWIKTNIQYFGGDPERITIFGESAGGWSVSMHLVSPMSRGLFDAAILQSSSANHPQLVDSPEFAFYKANIYAKAIGCLTGNSSIESDPEIMKCIKGKSSLELSQSENAFTSKLPYFFLATYGSRDGFLPVQPLKAVYEGQIAPVKVLMGNNRDEATIFMNYLMPDIFKKDSEPSLSLQGAQQVLSGLFGSVPKPTVDEIFEYYFQNVPDGNSEEIVETISKAFADYVFYCPVQFFAEKVKNAFFYYFTHRSTKEPLAEWLGVPHFSEVPYVFGLPVNDTISYTSEDGGFSECVMKKWTSFAETGYPLGDEYPESWPQFTKENRIVYELNPRQEGCLPHPRERACEFWRPYFVPEN